MTQYIVLIPDNEATWAARPAEEKATVFARHAEFAELLAERGHKVRGGAELTPSAAAYVVGGTREKPVVTAGPYAESAEQLSGFYLVDSDDHEDLLRCVAVLAEGEGKIEVRACVDHSGD